MLIFLWFCILNFTALTTREINDAMWEVTDEYISKDHLSIHATSVANSRTVLDYATEGIFVTTVFNYSWKIFVSPILGVQLKLIAIRF
jgi:hypothetical protein